ncbi:hypothetical protein L1049_019810 [Liquidambar formosana]|uniref:PGG domain-containing protein n=1 Tax=Liquidambar formosana TaxID=63359 RepID=A0AAP0SC69_LIQFO
MHMGSTSTDMDPEAKITRMYPDLLHAAEDGRIDTFENYTERLHLLLTPNKNTILHINITAQRREKESTELVGQILEKCPSLLRQANANDEIPLHLAARYGLSDTVKFLIERAKTLHQEDPEKGDVRQMVWMTNKEKDTALHEAIRFNHIDVVKLLIKEDPDLSNSANAAGETPLYLAAERGFRSLVKEILETCVSPAHGGPNGRTALHAAVIGNYEEILLCILGMKEARLITKEADQQGWTPLHYAALLGYSTYITDRDGRRTALHIAASKGHEQVVKALIGHSSDCCELVDKNGWNFIHFAAESGNLSTVKVVFENYSLTHLLNGKDNEGKTPLHLLANHHGPDTRLYSLVSDLIKHPRVDKMAFNKKNLNAFDIISANPTSTLKWKDNLSYNLITVDLDNVLQRHIKEELRKAGVRTGRQNVTYEDVGKGEKEDVGKGGKDDNHKGTYFTEIKEATETHIVVAALIATVAFAASFTMPGGYISDKGPDQGTPVLARKATFRAFVISNSIAMMLSSSAVFIYIFLAMPLPDKSKFHSYFKLAAYLNIFAAGAMMVAFMTGQYTVLQHSSGLAIATCVIGSSFFFFYYELFLRSYVAPLVKSGSEASFLDLLDKALDAFNDLLEKAIDTLSDILDACSETLDTSLIVVSELNDLLLDCLPDTAPVPIKILVVVAKTPFLVLLFALVFVTCSFYLLFVVLVLKRRWYRNPMLEMRVLN